MNAYSSNSEELPKATTQQQGTPRSNITVRSTQMQQHTHEECPKVATQVGTPISNITARSFPPCNNNKKTHKSKEHKHKKQKNRNT